MSAKEDLAIVDQEPCECTEPQPMSGSQYCGWCGGKIRDQKRLMIYVAGPISPRGVDVHEAPTVMYRNVQAAIQVGIEILRKGHNPYIPHLCYWVNLEMEAPYPETYPYIWYDLDYDWLRHCHALFYMGKSFGADKERKFAEDHGLRIFTNLDEIPTIRGLQDRPDKVE